MPLYPPLVMAFLSVSLLSSSAFSADITLQQQAHNHYQSGHYQEALQVSQKIIQQTPSNAEAYTISGLSSLALSDYVSADRHLKKAMLLTPRQPDGYNNYGVFLCQQHHPEQALDFFDKALDLPNKPSSKILLNAAICSFKAGDDLRSENYLQTLTQQFPSFAPGWYQLAYLQYRQARFSQTLQTLSQYHQISAATSDSLTLAYLSAKATGQLDLAERYQQQIHLLNAR